MLSLLNFENCLDGIVVADTATNAVDCWLKPRLGHVKDFLKIVFTFSCLALIRKTMLLLSFGFSRLRIATPENC